MRGFPISLMQIRREVSYHRMYSKSTQVGFGRLWRKIPRIGTILESIHSPAVPFHLMHQARGVLPILCRFYVSFARATRNQNQLPLNSGKFGTTNPGKRAHQPDYTSRKRARFRAGGGPQCCWGGELKRAWRMRRPGSARGQRRGVGGLPEVVAAFAWESGTGRRTRRKRWPV
jgi:hypothetical protein